MQSFRHFAAVVLGACALLSMAPQARAADDPHVLVLGRISDDPKAHYEQLKPLLDYVVPRMADVGITEGRILMARDMQQMTSYLRRGRVDWVTETSANAMRLQDRAGAEPLLLTERNGVGTYRSVTFVRNDSGIETLADLKGQRLAFQLPSSTSAYFVPAGELLAEGLDLEILLSPQDRLHSDAVGYLFARSELNIATWVHKGLVDVGVMSNLDWINPQRMPAAFRGDLEVFARSPDYPRAIELVRGDMDARVQARLAEVLMQAAEDPDAGDALLRFFKTTRFLPLDSDSLRALERIGRDVERVREDVE